jgi:hypothetical protein
MKIAVEGEAFFNLTREGPVLARVDVMEGAAFKPGRAGPSRCDEVSSDAVAI